MRPSPSRTGAAARGIRCIAALAALAALLSTGCAVALPGGAPVVMLGYATVSDDGHLAQRVVPGLDLDLSGAWTGLRLGWSDLRVVRPAASDAPRVTPGDGPQDGARVVAHDGVQFAPPLGICWRSADGLTHKLGWITTPAFPEPDDAAPLFVAQTLAGLSLDAGPVTSGLHLGLARLTVLSVPQTADGLWLLRHDGERTDFVSLHE